MQKAAHMGLYFYCLHLKLVDTEGFLLLTHIILVLGVEIRLEWCESFNLLVIELNGSCEYFPSQVAWSKLVYISRVY